MPSHIHMIFSDDNTNPSKLLGEFKTFTSKQMRKSIEAGFVEEAHHWKYSSAIDYCGGKGEVDVCLV